MLDTQPDTDRRCEASLLEYRISVEDSGDPTAGQKLFLCHLSAYLAHLHELTGAELPAARAMVLFQLMSSGLL